MHAAVRARFPWFIRFWMYPNTLLNTIFSYLTGTTLVMGDLRLLDTRTSDYAGEAMHAKDNFHNKKA
jgi:hypothetical protein